ncbi:hypothetical protein ACFC09_21555 [Streptomyces sp. NPDC056161]|uniref:hypothetical protein n=1 Tax=Streptomyces sp. NPDC056161 TaxID=3345732 RepID=UPI0035E3AB37
MSAPGWREVPPLQRTVGAPALVTDPVGFRGSLDTWRDTSFFTPLGHLVSPEAPSGLGHGLVAPSASAGAPTVSREVHPNARGRTRESGPSGPGGELRLAVVPLQRAGGAGASDGPRPASGASGTDAVDTAAPLVSARPPDMPLRQLDRVPAEGPRPGTAAEGPPPSAPAAPSPASPSPPVQRVTEPGSARPHGFGLGEPLSALPPTAQRKPAASTGGPLPPDESGFPPPAEPPSRPLLADDPLVVRTTDTDPPPAPAPASEPTLPTTAPATVLPVRIQRAAADGTPVPAEPAPAAEPVVPLVAQRSVPLFSGVLESAAEGVPDARSGAAGPRVVPLRWSSGPEGGRAATAGADPAPAEGAAPGRSPVPSAQRSVAPAAAPARPAARASAPTVSRALPDAGAVAVTAGVAQRMVDGSVVFHSPPAAAVRPLSYGSLPGPVPLPPAVQRDASGSEPPPPQPPDPPDPPATSAEPAPEPLPDSSGTASSAAGEQAPDPASGGSGRGTPKVDDELVRALFAPLSRLLKAELRLDRERAGRLIDTWH